MLRNKNDTSEGCGMLGHNPASAALLRCSTPSLPALSFPNTAQPKPLVAALWLLGMPILNCHQKALPAEDWAVL